MFAFRATRYLLASSLATACLANSFLPAQDAGSSFALPGRVPGQPAKVQLAEPSRPIGLATAENHVDLQDCAVHLIDDIDVPARESGLLRGVNVVEGQVVKQGELLAQIDDQLAQRQLEEAKLKQNIATEKAEDNTDVEAADKKQKLLAVMYDRKAKLLRDSSASQEDVETARFQKETSFFEYLKAQRDKKLAAEEAKAEGVKVNAANDSIARHQLVCPIDGHVFQVFKEPGEWVAAGDTVLRVARMNKLKATGLVDATLYSAQQIANRNVVITIQLAREQTTQLPGKIVYIDYERKEGGKKFQVWAEIDNQQVDGQWVLNPDDYVSMRILLN
jgi:multidrug efflux pump subunit AcrA (membrane-fusion protein)